MKYELNPHSSREEFTAYIQRFSKTRIFTQPTLDELVANIVNLGIDTYNFSLCANTAAKTIDKSLIPVLEKYLSLFMDKDQKKEKDNQVGGHFTRVFVSCRRDIGHSGGELLSHSRKTDSNGFAYGQSDLECQTGYEERGTDFLFYVSPFRTEDY